MVYECLLAVSTIFLLDAPLSLQNYMHFLSQDYCMKCIHHTRCQSFGLLLEIHKFQAKIFTAWLSQYISATRN